MIKQPFKVLAVILTFLILIASAYAYFSFKRTLKNVVAWENLLVVIMGVGEYLTSNPSVEISDNIESPTDVSDYGIIVLPEWPRQNKADKLLLDDWGTPMKFYAVRINGKVYLKGISAGPDRRFHTSDDIINSEYDDSGNIFHPRNLLKNN